MRASGRHVERRDHLVEHGQISVGHDLHRHDGGERVVIWYRCDRDDDGAGAVAVRERLVATRVDAVAVVLDPGIGARAAGGANTARVSSSDACGGKAVKISPGVS